MMKAISSTQNKRVRYVKSLQTKARLRRSERRLVLEGKRLIADALRRGALPELLLYAPDSADYEIIARLQNSACAIVPVSPDVLRFVSDTQHSPGLLGVFRLPKPPIPQSAEPVLVLDGIGEPGNLGTILRTAAAAGVNLAIIAPGCADPYNPKALRAGMGAHFLLPLVEATWKEISGFCQGLRTFAATADGDSQYTDVDWRHAWALIVGNEARGLSPQAQRLAQVLVSIPMSAGVESLNVASASAVILFEARRQRLGAASALS